LVTAMVQINLGSEAQHTAWGISDLGSNISDYPQYASALADRPQPVFPQPIAQIAADCKSL